LHLVMGGGQGAGAHIMGGGPHIGGGHGGGAQLLAGILGGARMPPMIAAGIPITAPQIPVHALKIPPHKAKGDGGPQVGGAQGGGPQGAGAGAQLACR